MRTLLLPLLLLVPALAGCLAGGGEAADPDSLEGSGWSVTILEDTELLDAGDWLKLSVAKPVEQASYNWSVDGATYEGPVLYTLLGPGTYVVVLEGTLDGAVLRATRVVEVAGDPDAPPGTNGSGGTNEDPDEAGGASGDPDPDPGPDPGSDPDPTPGPDPEPEPCVFPDEPVHVAGQANVYTFSLPWTCQPDSWSWDLGDGNTSHDATVRHEYARDGTYTVVLTLVHDGETLVRTGTVQVTDVPLRIVADTDLATATFRVTWGRDVESVAWDFGDGTTSTEAEPTHTYPGVGPWAVTADVKGPDGAIGFTQRSIYLDSYPLTIQPDVDQDIVTFSFDWGWSADRVSWTFLHDDSTSDKLAPVVQYSRPDTYQVRLEVQGEGRSAVAVSPVVVTEVPVRITLEQDKNHVTFTPVWYEDLSGYQWNFGDGFTSTEATPQHRYYAYQDFTVTLRANGEGVQQVAEPATVTVTEIPLLIEGELGDGNRWDGVAHWAPATSIDWTLGDGATGTGDRVDHVFVRKGSYVIQVTATDGTHTESATHTLEVPTGLMPDWGEPDERAVRPGTQMNTEGGQCTAAFLLHQDASRFFVATAAHCAGTAGGVGGRSISTTCSENVSHPLGTKTTFEDWRTGRGAVEGTLVYSSWMAMTVMGVTDANTCVGNDFALFEVDYADTAKMNPAVLYFEGPLDLGPAGAQPDGSSMRGYGASSTRNQGAVGDNHETNAKGGSYVAYNGGWLHQVRFDNPSIPGDSGGPLLNQAGDALGVLSTIEAFPNAGTNSYTDLAKALAWMEDHTELELELVSWDDWDPNLPVASSDDPLACVDPTSCDPAGLFGPGDPLPGLPGTPGVPPLAWCPPGSVLDAIECILGITVASGRGD